MWLQRVRSSLLTDLAQKEPFMNSPESNKNRRCFNPPVMLNISAEWAWHSKTIHYFYRVFPFMTSFRLPRAISLHLFSHHHEVVKWYWKQRFIFQGLQARAPGRSDSLESFKTGDTPAARNGRNVPIKGDVLRSITLLDVQKGVFWYPILPETSHLVFLAPCLMKKMVMPLAGKVLVTNGFSSCTTRDHSS